ncbi:Ornithine decarboxylase, constitutive [Raoultella terrigena]|uniref:Ornithine decarboxylase, constitutive n=1 Tax=Raoultella terrigena TaxID=577 RepID=A0A3P8IR43_RAOTE|nr:Ornithine decarboxylase, constitutive [Raoultella terrigena]
MKSMHIAASCELVPHLSTHRRVVALDSTDFTDVAAVVITAADSRSGILSLLKRSGFNLPVYLLSDSEMAKPDGVAGGDDRQRAGVAGAGSGRLPL